MTFRLAHSTVFLALVLPTSVAHAQAGGNAGRAQAVIQATDLGASSNAEIVAKEVEGAALVGANPTIGLSHDLPKPFAAFSASAMSLRDSMVALARAQIGRRYRLGGTTPEHGFDCSGLVRYVLAALHIDIARTAHEQAHAGAVVPRDPSQLKPGDLVTFGSGPQHISHIGIYVGNGRFVQASSRAGRVIETNLSRPLVHGAEPWRGARRITKDADSAPALSEASEVSADDGGEW
jgi:cell wall-associated NlpC family hydrolase